jgi:hypothetical protein
MYLYLSSISEYGQQSNIAVLWPTYHYHSTLSYWGKADDRNCNYGHPKMADVESGKNNDAAQQKL